MYNTLGVSGTLAATGLAGFMNNVWLAMAGFTLIAVGFAALRLVPKPER